MNRMRHGNREYENWNGSRWEFTKRRSQWHFDNLRPPEPGADSFTHVCRFDADFTADIAVCLKRVVPCSWSTRNQFSTDPTEPKKRMYSADAEESDLLRAGADPYMKIFERAVATDCVTFDKINTALGMTESTIKFHNQRTGQMLTEHIDNFAGRAERDNSFKVVKIDKHPEIIRRFVIMLSDWQLGQVFMLGNATWTQWRAGDCITWEWRDIPHATCNMGWHDRPMLQITGHVSDITDQMLAGASRDRIIKL